MLNRSVSAIMAILTCVSVFAAKPKTDNRLKSAGYKYLETNFGTYDKIQKTIHDYAEPGYKEYKSSKLLADHLAANGFKIEMGVADIPTAFIATYGSGSPVIGILAEYDALPGLSQDTTTVNSPLVEGAYGHGCGHNLLGTASVAGAVAISKYLAEGHQGTVKLFGCPAEEGGGGKAFMTREGCFDGLDAAFDWHPESYNRILMNGGIASMSVVFTFKGIASHAAATPWKGRSALDGVEAFNHMMNMMREHVTPETRIHYVITDGGGAPNVVPETASVNYYFRHPTVEEMLSVFERAKLAAEGAAMGTGTTVSYEILNGNYPRLLNEHLSRIALKNLKTVGGLVLDQREKAFVSEIMKNSGMENTDDLSALTSVVPELGPKEFSGASSDVGNVSQLTPIFKMNVACNIPGGAIHTWQLATMGGTTIGTKACINVAKVFYLTALDLYNSPDDVKAIREEYIKERGTDYKFVPLMGDRPAPLDYTDTK